MYKVEIVAGLKSTMDRGYTLEQAIQTFINAGYPKEDVLDSAERLRKEPVLIMQVTPPLEVKEKKPTKGLVEEKPSLFHRLHLPHIHFHLPQRKEKLEQIKIPVSPKAESEEKKSEVKRMAFLEEASPIQKIHPEERFRIKELELKLRTKKYEPEKKPGARVETTAILELPKVAPRKVKLEKRPIALEKVKVPKIVQKHEVRIQPERTAILELPKSRPRKSDNAIFIILIILLMMLLGALIFSFLYQEILLEIIQKILES